MYNFEIPETMIRKENTTSDDQSKIFKPSSSSSAKTWSRSNDPRIVRVSRAFGGKDRHSKVFTVKGLRDRRIRLSVPTAVYIYNLQERLGLNQPSKVVDWLLKAAKDDIDELPPLQIPPGSFCHNGHQVSSSSSHQVLTLGGGINWWNHDQFKNPGSNIGSSYLNPTTAVPYNPLVKWDPSNLTLSQYPQKNQTLSEDLPTFNLVQFPYTTVSVPSGSQQVLLYQPAGISQSFFNSHVSAMDAEFVHKNQAFQGLQLSNFPNPLQSQNSPRNERNKDVGFHLQ